MSAIQKNQQITARCIPCSVVQVIFFLVPRVSPSYHEISLAAVFLSCRKYYLTVITSADIFGQLPAHLGTTK